MDIHLRHWTKVSITFSGLSELADDVIGHAAEAADNVSIHSCSSHNSAISVHSAGSFVASHPSGDESDSSGNDSSASEDETKQFGWEEGELMAALRLEPVFSLETEADVDLYMY